MTLLSCMDGTSAEAIQGMVELWWPSGMILDTTFGNGNFWKGFQTARVIGCDGMAARARDVQCDFRSLPFGDESFPLVVFDPPFQPATVNGLIGDRFTKPVKGIAGVRQLLEDGILECWRVSSDGLIVKVQDYIHDHKPVWMSMWVHAALREPWDFVTLRNGYKKRLKATNWTRQLSVWRNHSTFWIYRKLGKR
jgi:hypothetical protein